MYQFTKRYRVIRTRAALRTIAATIGLCVAIGGTCVRVAKLAPARPTWAWWPDRWPMGEMAMVDAAAEG